MESLENKQNDEEDLAPENDLKTAAGLVPPPELGHNNDRAVDEEKAKELAADFTASDSVLGLLDSFLASPGLFVFYLNLLDSFFDSLLSEEALFVIRGIIVMFLVH